MATTKFNPLGHPSLSTDILAEDVLLAQEANRVGTLRIRFTALIPHPLQRPVDALWVENLAMKDFENGANVQKSAHPIMVMAVEPGEVEVIHASNQLPTVNPATKFYLISGQHRVAAMKVVIMNRIKSDMDTLHPVPDEELLQDAEAEWPAVVFKRGL
jgi:hypothetical protein